MFPCKCNICGNVFDLALIQQGIDDDGNAIVGCPVCLKRYLEGEE